jgi:hypothetical protein
MPETFYVRTRDQKHYIEAKILTDLQGNPIVSRNLVQSSWNLFDADHNPIGTNTNGYVIVPADFDIKKAIDFGRSISEMMKASADDPDDFESNLTDAFVRFGNAFLPRTGELDIQTHYNGATGGNVPAFRDAASYIFGVAGHAAGIPLAVLKAGGGAVNRWQYHKDNVKDISGDWFNSPENVNSMTDGYQAQQNRVFGQKQMAVPPPMFSDAGTIGVAPRGPNATGFLPSDGPIGLFSGKPMRFIGAPIFNTLMRSGAANNPDRPNALDDLLRGYAKPRPSPIDASAAVPSAPNRQNLFGNGNGAASSATSADNFLAPPMSTPQNSQEPLSLNDAYLEYRRRLDARQSQLSATAAQPTPPAASDDSNFSGGLLGRLTALMAINPQNPAKAVPPLSDEELRALFGNDVSQPWTMQSWR